MKAGYREVKRVIKYGPRYPWLRYFASANILETRPIYTDGSGDVTACVLTSRYDWLSCLWSLVSFYEFSGLRLPLLIYSDGTLDENHGRAITKVFPGARIVTSLVGEGIVENRLCCYPNCLRFRTALPYARKLFDLPILCGSPIILVLDSDVIFLKRPSELMMHLVPNSSAQFIFERDMCDAYCITRADIKKAFNVDIAPRVNTGIMVANVFDFDYSRIEKWLSQGALTVHPWAEQTLWAMYAGQERTAFLGEEYDVTMSTEIGPNTVAKHYVKPIRDFLYIDGIPRLREKLEDRAVRELTGKWTG